MQAIIFDMDGLMIDSEKITYEGYRISLEKRGYHASIDFYKSTLGSTRNTARELYKKRYGNDIPYDEILDEVIIYISDFFENQGVPLKQGLIELLQYLKEHHYPRIVATSSSRNRVKRIFEIAHLTEYFDDMICGDEVVNGKPDPEIFLKACAKLNVKPQDALVLEDSQAGIQAASLADIPVICIPDMKYPEKQYEEKTLAIMNSLYEVLDYLKKNTI